MILSLCKTQKSSNGLYFYAKINIMNTDKIQALLLTIEKGSISAAAEQMNYTPSAVSRCIQSLERDLGVHLISRSRHGVEISSAGQMMLPELNRIIRDEMLLKERAAQLTEGVSGTIRLGICYPAFYPWVSSVMAAFKDLYPDINYVVRNGFSSELMEMVMQNEIDLCMISKREASCGWVPLLNDEMVAILPLDHPLAASDTVPISIYAEEPYLDLHSGKNTDNARTLETAGVQPKEAMHLDDSSALYPMVEAGLGIGMENRINTVSQRGKFVIKPFDPPQIIHLGIAFREDILPVTRKFIDYLSNSKDLFEYMEGQSCM